MTSPLQLRYQKARSAVAWFHLEDWSVVRLHGPDSRDFLQRLGTADVRPLLAGSAAQTLFLKGDGRLIADCAVICTDDHEFHLVTPAACKDELLESLERFHFTEDLAIADHSTQYHVGMLAGPKRAEALRATAAANPAAIANVIAADVTFAPGSPRLLLLIPDAAVAPVRSSLYEAVEAAGGVIGGADLYHTLRIEEGLPLFSRDLTEKTIPLEAGLKPAISFTKGCFPGQEVVARINNLGHPANVLVGLALPETTEDLTGLRLLHEGKEIGRITSVAFSPALAGTLGLGYVKWAHREPGTVLQLDHATPMSATVTALPLPGLSQ